MVRYSHHPEHTTIWHKAHLGESLLDVDIKYDSFEEYVYDR